MNSFMHYVTLMNTVAASKNNMLSLGKYLGKYRKKYYYCVLKIPKVFWICMCNNRIKIFWDNYHLCVGRVANIKMATLTDQRL